MKLKDMKFACFMYGNINTIDGKRKTVRRYFDGAGDVYQLALQELQKRKDKGYPWKGDAVNVITPLGQKVIVEVPWEDYI